MRCAGDGAVETVPREPRELVLGGRPAAHLAGAGAQDSERLAVEGAQCFRLVEDRRQLQELDPVGRSWCGEELKRGRRREPAAAGRRGRCAASAFPMPCVRRTEGAPRRASTSSRSRGTQGGRTDTASPSRSARLRRPARILLGVDERIGAADGVSGEDVWPRDMRGAQKSVQVGRELMAVLRAAFPLLHPSPARSNEQTRVVARHVRLHPRPARRPFAEAVEEDDRRRA